MNISKLSNKTGASVRSLRYYEAKGLLEANRLENGYRDFHENMVEKVKIIQMYLNIGFSTEEIADIIECPMSNKNGGPLCKKAVEAYKQKLSEVERQIKIMEILKSQLLKKINDYEESTDAPLYKGES